MFPYTRRNKPAASNRKPRRRTLTAAMSAEVLEDRTLLTGLVMEDSVFSVTQFARNIEEQIPVDTTGPNGVVGYSYAIIDGDPSTPITDGGDDVFKGNRRMAWDTDPFGLTPRPTSPDHPQEIASISKMITGAAILHLLQEEVLADNSEVDPVDDALQFRGLLEAELDRPIVDFLPGNWGPGNPSTTVNGWTPFFNSITIEELLTHTSGLLGDTSTGGVVTGPAGASAYTYGGLQQIAEGGTVNVNSLLDQTWAADYWTNNFSWFRVMLPYMWDAVDNSALSFNASTGSMATSTGFFPPPLGSPMTSDTSLENDLIAAMIDDWGNDVAPEPSFGYMDITPAQATASIYKHYASEYILKPSGVTDPKSETSGPNFTLLYPLDPTIVQGSLEYGPIMTAQQNGQDTGNLTAQLGPRGWNLSAKDTARTTSGIRHGATDGATILHAVTLDLMEERGLGYQHSTNPNYVGDFGQYWGHNGVNFAPPNSTLTTNLPASVPAGATPATPPTLAPANNTVAIGFPNNVEAAILINSQIQTFDGPTTPVNAATQVVIGGAFNANSPASIGPTAIGTGTNAALINAYDNAWTELAYEGAGTVDDTFTVRTNPSNNVFIDIEHQIPGVTGPLTVTTITRRADTLHKLTLYGLGGNDTFNIESLPAGMELVINGGNGGDTVTVGGQAGTFDLAANALGTLTFHGGAGFDELTIDDTDDNDLNQTYTIKNDHVTRTGAGTYWYEGVSELILNANGQANLIDVQSTTNSTITTINGQGGNDTITMGGAEIDGILGLVDIDGGDDDDTVRFWDVFSFTANDYEIRSQALLLGTSAVIGYGEDDALELWSGNEDDTVSVESLAAGQTLDLVLGHGDDSAAVNLLSNPLTTNVFGKVIVHGGDGGDDTLTVNDTTSLEGTEYTITRTSITRTIVEHPDIQPIEYDGIETLNVNGAIPASTYLVEGTSAETNVNAGIGADTFEIGFLQRLDFIDEILTINGGDNVAGEDTVEINDRLGTSALFGLVNNAVFGFTFATIFLKDVEQATLEANSLNNQILIENAFGPTRYTVNGWFGVDTFSVAEGTGDLSNIHTPLILNGGPIDDDHLLLYDSSSPGPRNYDVTENSIDRILFGEHSLFNTDIGVTFSAMTSVELHMNDLNSTVDVESTHPDTQYIFHGNDGADTLNLNRHTDGAVESSVDIDGVNVTSAAMDIEHNDFEQLNVNLGEEATTVRVHNLQSPADVNLGPGNDRLQVTPNSANLNTIHYPITVDGQGGLDRVFLLDQNFGGIAPFTVTKNSVDRFLFGPLIAPGLTYFDVDDVRLFMGSGNNVVNINTTEPGTDYFFDGGIGDDTFNVNLLPTSPLTLFGNVGADHAVITGDESDNEVSISAGFSAADINMPNTETASFDGNGGADVLVAHGVAGMTEQMEIGASTTANAGDLRITTLSPRGNMLLDVVFEDTEFLDQIANPGDGDTATFIGTDADDRFEINLGAAGTNADPVLQFFPPDGLVPLLTLRDYQGFDTLGVLGGDGGDAFNVYVAPAGPGNGRNLNIDGGSPSGPGNPNDIDRLTVYREFQQPPPPTGGNPPSTPDGMFDIDYEFYSFLITFSDIEHAQLKSANGTAGNGNGNN